MYTRLHALQNIMSNAVQSPAGCSVKAWRSYTKAFYQRRDASKKAGVVDLDLVMQFMNLDLNFQEELCASGGTTTEVVKDNLLMLSAYCQPA